MKPLKSTCGLHLVGIHGKDLYRVGTRPLERFRLPESPVLGLEVRMASSQAVHGHSRLSVEDSFLVSLPDLCGSLQKSYTDLKPKASKS